MTQDCIIKAGNTYCPKCHRAAPDICWEKEFSHAVENGSPLQKEIYVELQETLEENMVARPPTKLEGIPVAPKRVEPPAPKKTTRGKKPYKAGVAK